MNKLTVESAFTGAQTTGALTACVRAFSGVVVSLIICFGANANVENTKTGHIDDVQAAAPIVKPGAPGQASEFLTPEQSVTLGQSSYTKADILFMQNMAVHHQQAVDMVSLIGDRSTHVGVISIGQRISLSQSSEIKMMHTWLRRRGQPVSSPGGHMMIHDDHKKTHGNHKMGDQKMSGHKKEGMKMQHADDVPVMTGMLSVNQMRSLAAADGVEFDRQFLSGMILHHQGALIMVDALLEEPGSGQDPEISEFLSSIIADQTSEILRMRSMLSDLP